MIKKFNDLKKIISAICAAPIILASAKVLEDVKSTCYHPSKDFVKIMLDNNAKFIEQDYVIDGRFVTGKNMQTTISFAYALADTINGTEDNKDKYY